MGYDARYFDGQTARDHPVKVALGTSSIIFSGDDVAPRSWSVKGLSTVDAPMAGQALRLSHGSQPGARLVINDDAFLSEMLTAAPHLKGGFNPKTTLRVAAWIGVGLSVFAGLAYFTLNFAPQKFAVLLPDKWTHRVGDQMEEALVDNAKICNSPKGDLALATIVGRLAEGDPNLPPIRVRIYNIPIMNAFTLPGGNIVMTRALIEKADAPDEVAGVLAHEMGHATHHDSEAQLVRITGMQILLSVASGTSGGTNASSVAGLAAILNSSRDAERAADAYAVSTLTAARIDPLGLKKFFGKVQAEEGRQKPGTLGKLGSLFATHPGTAERIELIKPAANDVKLQPVMSQEQWQDLQRICS
jgi:beta-barrel assembly-enhancing protease